MTRDEIMRDIFDMASARYPGIERPVIDWVASATGILVWTPNAYPVRVAMSPAERDHLWKLWNKAES